MNPNLSMWELVQAQTLLAAVGEQGSLTAAAVWLGLPLRTAQTYWKRWGLWEDFGKLPTGAAAHLKNARPRTEGEKALQRALWCAKEAARSRRRRAAAKARQEAETNLERSKE